MLALALGIATAGRHEFAAAWIAALAHLSDESGDDYHSAGPPHMLAEARAYLAGFCSELGVVEFADAQFADATTDATTDAWLAGEALAGFLRRKRLPQ